MRRGLGSQLLLPAAIIGGGLAIAVALFVAGVIHAGALGLELAKGGIELLVVVVLGSAVAFGFRQLDDRREERRRLDEYRVAFVEDIRKTDRRIRAARRTLNAFSFGRPVGGLTAEQCREYDLQMRELDEAQLALEALSRTVHDDKEGHIFGRNRDTLLAALDHAEKYMHVVIGDWETHRGKVTPGTDWTAAIGPQEGLRRFLGRSGAQGGVADGLIEPVGTAVEQVQELRFTRGSD